MEEMSNRMSSFCEEERKKKRIVNTIRKGIKFVKICWILKFNRAGSRIDRWMDIVIIELQKLYGTLH